MKLKSLVIAAALAGGLLSTASAVTAAAPAPSKFEAPVPAKVIQPIQLPARHGSSLVTLTMTIDQAGKPHNVRVASTHDQEAYKRIVSTVSRWEFTPARRNGVPVATRVELPLEVVGT